MAEETTLRCCACNLALEPRKTTLNYMGHGFSVTLPRCPGCGQVYIPEALVSGRMLEVEKQLEEK
ncbi:MAG: hypothetical protein GXX99_04385 [Clostridiales bacterium]|nr:hypothetical protein [Clostridiales bacterium]